jgi:hypothetical protein
MPACCASFSLLHSRTTPAASVAAAATPKIAAALAVPMARPAAALRLSVLRVPFASSCPSGACLPRATAAPDWRA